MRHTLPIVCAITRNYALPLAVMLESLKQHLRPDLRPVLYLIHAGLPSSTLAAISSVVDVHPIVPSRDQLAAIPSDTRFPREAAVPLLIPELLPSGIDRVVFLDADTLVMDDLGALWETTLGPHVVAAAPDGAVPVCSAPRGVKGWQALGIPRDAPYFNCGVLVIHVERWRERDVTRRARRYLERTRGPIDFLHQEALNAVLWDDWHPLDTRWNLLASLPGRSHARPGPSSRPGIVHFAGRVKPWRGPVSGPFNGPYRTILERVRPRFSCEPTGLRDWAYSVYDRRFRPVCRPLKQFLWRRRLL